MITILDCYTDEPAGLGVPPYLGTYPRYIYGYLSDNFKDINYITIDDLRFFSYYNLDDKKKEINHKTNIKIYNLTKNINRIKEIAEKTTKIIVILGVHTPGKYLSAVPGTLKEINFLLDKFNAEKILTGPVIYGTQSEGGKFFEKIENCPTEGGASKKCYPPRKAVFNKMEKYDFPYDEIKDYAVKGAEIIKQIPDLRIIEIETSHGCSRLKGCSFCTEPIKHKLEFRQKEDILEEVKEFYKLGCRYFRLGKQSCFYAYPYAIELLKDIRKECRDIKLMHIDNVNPVNVISKKGVETTKAIVKYCSSGNVAAFGIESFDPAVIEENNLNCRAEQVAEAIKILNKYGSETGVNGMQSFLPGINLLFGLKGESKKTHSYNLNFLKNILKQNLLLRRINIRQVTIFEGTMLHKTAGNKFIKKNKKYYWKWRNEIRQKIDFMLLKRLVPINTILKDVRMEVYDGNTTFGRQLGTYPLIVGVKQRLELNKFYNIKITGHMLRSVTGVVV